jgi:hypothetical protein
MVNIAMSAADSGSKLKADARQREKKLRANPAISDYI